jgi:hypothetical protein
MCPSVYIIIITIKPKVAPIPKRAAGPPPSMDINVTTEAGPNSVKAHVPNISAINFCVNVGSFWVDVYFTSNYIHKVLIYKFFFNEKVG